MALLSFPSLPLQLGEHLESSVACLLLPALQVLACEWTTDLTLAGLCACSPPTPHPHDNTPAIICKLAPADAWPGLTSPFDAVKQISAVFTVLVSHTHKPCCHIQDPDKSLLAPYPQLLP